jgi:tetratricopeptide (TPR) repeat protein
MTAAAIESLSEIKTTDSDDLLSTLTIWHINAMIMLGHYESAKVKSEEVLSTTSNDSETHLKALICFVRTSYRLRRFTVALMGLQQIDELLDRKKWNPRLRSIARSTHGQVHVAIGDLKCAKECFESSLESFQQAGDDFEACKARINLGQVLIDSDSLGAARRHLVQSLSEASEGKFDKLVALAASHLAVLNYKKGDTESAESFAIRSNAIARPNGYQTILFRNVFYLWKIAVDKRDSAAMSSNERTLRALSNRIYDEFPELEQFRRFTEGGDR